MKKLVKKDLNFVAAMQIKKTTDAGKLKKFLAIAVPTVALLVCVEMSVMYGIRSSILEDKIEQTNMSITKIQKSDDYQELMVSTKILENSKLYLDNANLVKQAIDTYPQITSQTIGQIRSAVPEGASISGITYAGENCVMLITGQVAAPQDTVKMVRALRTLGIFSTVAHRGYVDDAGQYKYEIDAYVIPASIMYVEVPETNTEEQVVEENAN